MSFLNSTAVPLPVGSAAVNEHISIVLVWELGRFLWPTNDGIVNNN